MDNFQIETAQNIHIYQNVAGIVERIFAFLIDFFVIFTYWILVIFLFGTLDLDSNDNWELTSFIMIVGLPMFLYHVLFETFWDGRSMGKMAMQLRVVKLDGSKPGFGSYFVRWMLRIVDISLFGGSVALVTILLNGKGQRLGDMAAGTTVISEKEKVRLSDTLLMDIAADYLPLYPQVTVFTDTDMQRIKIVFSDAKKEANHNVILRLAVKIQEIMGVTLEETPLEFIDRVIADYNYYTQN